VSLLKDMVCNAVELVEHVVKLEAKSLVARIDEQKKSMESCFKNMFLWRSVVTFCMLLLLAGIGLVIAGAFMLLAPATGEGTAALIVGVILTLLAIILTVTVKQSVK
jgi:hypothetical protein